MSDFRFSNNSNNRQVGLTVIGARVFSLPLSMVIPVAYMAALLISACVPTDGAEEQRHFLWFLALVPATLQNFLHIPAYALLAFLWRWSLGGMGARTAIATSLTLTIAFGVFQEWAQSLVPGRYASFYDVIFDAVGAVVGVWCFGRLRAARR